MLIRIGLLLVVGCWLLVVGCWLLVVVVGCCLLVVGCGLAAVVIVGKGLTLHQNCVSQEKQIMPTLAFS